jgi:asparaginyl-tRNA synthetase
VNIHLLNSGRLSTGTAVKLSGAWVESYGNKQRHELKVSSVSVLGENDAESNPIQPKYQTVDYLRTVPHLRPRIPNNALLLRLRSRVVSSLTRFFDEEGFVQTHTPVITSSDCEGAGEVFTISSNASREKSKPESEARVEHFFREPKYLTVSAQLHLEALAQAVDKVWTLSPTFRAEKSDTPRHLSEFYMLEAEQCFVDDANQIMDLIEKMLRFVATDTLDSKLYQELLQARGTTSPEDVDPHVDAATLEQRWKGLRASYWPRITYESAMELLVSAHEDGEVKFEFPPSHKEGLAAEHERYLATTVGNGSPVFVTDYPAEQKPFYMAASASGSNTVACFDLLVPDLCELVGGSMREHRSKELIDTMKEKGVANLDWYQDLRKYGSVPHGGFGLGFDRLLCYLSGVANLRDVVAFPRWYGRCDC